MPIKKPSFRVFVRRPMMRAAATSPAAATAAAAAAVFFCSWRWMCYCS
jgi:hypothetical protein